MRNGNFNNTNRNNRCSSCNNTANNNTNNNNNDSTKVVNLSDETDNGCCNLYFYVAAPGSAAAPVAGPIGPIGPVRPVGPISQMAPIRPANPPGAVNPAVLQNPPVPPQFSAPPARPIGPAAQGVAGAFTGIPGNSSQNCACVSQIAYILDQMLQIFPGQSITVNMQNQSATSGILYLLTPPYPNSGVLLLDNAADSGREAINICQIASINLSGNNSFFNDAGVLKINFLPPPVPEPVGCGANCERAIRQYLTEVMNTGVFVSVIAGGIPTPTDLVTAVGYGVFLIGEKTLVFTCATDRIIV